MVQGFALVWNAPKVTNGRGHELSLGLSVPLLTTVVMRMRIIWRAVPRTIGGSRVGHSNVFRAGRDSEARFEGRQLSVEGTLLLL